MLATFARLSESLFEQGRPEDAEPAYRAALLLDRRRNKSLCNLATCMDMHSKSSEEEHAEMKAALEEALALDARKLSFDNLALLGYLCYKEDEWDASAAHYRVSLHSISLDSLSRPPT